MRLSVLLIGFLAVLGGVLGFGYLALPTLAEWAVSSTLAEKGFPKATLTVRGIGLTRAEMVDVSLGPDSGVGADRIVVSYSPGRLAERILDGITLVGPRLTVGVDADGLDIGPLGSFTEDTDGGAGWRLVGPVGIADGRLAVATPFGDVVADVAGDVLITDGLGTEAGISFALDHEAASAKGRIDAIVDPEQNLQLSVRIDDATSAAVFAFETLSGTVYAKGRLPDGLEAGGSVSAADVRMGDLALGNVDLAGGVSGRALEAELLTGGDRTGLAAVVRLRTADIFDPGARVQIESELATDGLRGGLALPDDMNVIGALDIDVSAARGDFQALAKSFETGMVRASGEVAGTVQARLLGIRAPKAGVDATVDGVFDFRVRENGWRVDPITPLGVDLLLGDWFYAGTLAAAADYALISGGPGVAAPLQLAMLVDGTVNRDIPISGEAGGALWLGGNGPTFEGLALRIDPVTLRAGGLEMAFERINLRLDGPWDALDIGVSTELGFSGRAGGADIAGGRLTLTGALDIGDGNFRLHAAPCLDLGIASITFDGRRLRPGPLDICAAKEDAPLLVLNKDDSGWKQAHLAATLGATEATLDGTGVGHLSGTLPRIGIEADYDLTRGTWWGAADLDGGKLTVGDRLAVSQIDARFRAAGRETILDGKLDVASATFRYVDRMQSWPAVSLSGDGAYVSERASFEGTAKASGLSASVAAEHTVAGGNGRASIRLSPWDLAAGPAPAEVFPALTGDIADAAGLLRAEAEAVWKSGGLSTSGRVTFENIAFGTVPAEIAGLSGSVTMSDLMTLKSSGPQHLSVGFLDPGIPLTDGKITFQLPGDGTLQLIEARWPIAGGTLHFRDVSMPLDRLPDQITAEIDALDVSVLARLTELDDFEAEGLLSGKVPVRLGSDGPVLDGAQLKSIGGGIIRYTSPEAEATLNASGQTAEILTDALKDFRFTELGVTVNGAVTGDLTADAAIKGYNPNLYDGKRIELNVHLEGALRELLQSASVIQDLPAAIRDRVQDPPGVQ